MRLLDFRDPVAELSIAIRKLPVDPEEPLVTMSNKHALNAVQRVLSHELSPVDLSLWADLIEMREDIDIEGGRNAPLRQFVYETATPEFYPVTSDFLIRWERELARPVTGG